MPADCRHFLCEVYDFMILGLSLLFAKYVWCVLLELISDDSGNCYDSYCECHDVTSCNYC